MTKKVLNKPSKILFIEYIFVALGMINSNISVSLILNIKIIIVGFVVVS